MTLPLSKTRRSLMEAIARIPYFEQLAAEDLLLLVNQGYPLSVAPQEFICREDDIGNSFYIILSGTLEVISVRKNQFVSLLGEGEFFGEISLLMGTPRTVSVRALSEARVFVVCREHLQELLAKQKNLAAEIAGKLLERQHILVNLGVLEASSVTKSDRDAAYQIVLERLQKLFLV